MWDKAPHQVIFDFVRKVDRRFLPRDVCLFTYLLSDPTSPQVGCETSASAEECCYAPLELIEESMNSVVF